MVVADLHRKYENNTSRVGNQSVSFYLADAGVWGAREFPVVISFHCRSRVSRVGLNGQGADGVVIYAHTRKHRTCGSLLTHVFSFSKHLRVARFDSFLIGTGKSMCPRTGHPDQPRKELPFYV
jgi:hypothetical protein